MRAAMESRRWTVDFYNFTVELASLDGELAGLGDVHGRAMRNGAQHGTPVIVHLAGRVDPRINLFFRTGPMAGAQPSTWRRYAYALVVWLEFLAASGRGWDEATVGDVEAFKVWRLTDLRNEGRVMPTSFDTDRAALSSFYSWAALRYGVGNPVRTVRGTPRRLASTRSEPWMPDRGSRGFRARDGLRPAGSARRQVKWMLRPDRKSTRLNSSHTVLSRMPSSA